MSLRCLRHVSSVSAAITAVRSLPLFPMGWESGNWSCRMLKKKVWSWRVPLLTVTARVTRRFLRSWDYMWSSIRSAACCALPVNMAGRSWTGNNMRVTEIFHSIQGESSFVGQPCVFVRLTGCPLRCTWCDTEYAFYGGNEQSIDHILAKVESYGCRLVEIT